jgi:hypothetical protein
LAPLEGTSVGPAIPCCVEFELGQAFACGREAAARTSLGGGLVSRRPPTRPGSRRGRVVADWWGEDVAAVDDEMGIGEWDSRAVSATDGGWPSARRWTRAASVCGCSTA